MQSKQAKMGVAQLPILGCLMALSFLTGAFVMLQDWESEQIDRIDLKAIELEHLDALLMQRLLKARTGLDGFDAVASTVTAIDDAVNALQVLVESESELQVDGAGRFLTAFEKMENERAGLIDEVKTTHELLINSQSFLPGNFKAMLSGGPLSNDQRDLLTTLIAETLALPALVANVQTAAKAEDALVRAASDPQLADVVRHARVVVDCKMKLAHVFRSFEAFPSERILAELQEVIDERQAKIASRATLLTISLYAICMLLVPCVFIILGRLRSQNSTLEQAVHERTRQLRENQEALIYSAKMVTLGEMAGGIAHEINNPLAVMMLRARHIQRMLAAPLPENLKRAGDFAETIENTGRRIEAIVKGLRTFSRRGSDDPFVETAVSGIVTDTLALCESSIVNHGIQLRVGAIPPSAKLLCRPVQLSQIILNLLQNAVQELKKKPEEARWIALDYSETPQAGTFTVVDGGSGIPAEVRDRIFEPFFTTKDVGEGTGLGLSISKGIAEAHEGTLSLDTHRPNTTFVLRLPRAA